MAAAIDRNKLVDGLVHIGELEITGEDRAMVDAYFAPSFVFHAPDGRDLDYDGLQNYFASLRAAFDNRTITRGIILVDGNCRLSDHDRRNVRSRVHALPGRAAAPNGQRVTFELTNIFRYDDEGRLAEEWIQTDNRSVLRQLGAEGR
ncbi:MAG: ester cyclase [Acidimicrobiia bacterium]